MGIGFAGIFGNLRVAVIVRGGGEISGPEVKGTPVLVFGSYDFDAPKPWLQLVRSPHALDISKNEIEKQMMPYLNAVLAQQKIRQNSVK